MGYRTPPKPLFCGNSGPSCLLPGEKLAKTCGISPLASPGSPRRLARSLADGAGFSARRRPRALAFRAQDRVEALKLGRIRGTGPGQVAIIDLMLFHTGTNGQGERRFTAAGFR